MVEPEDADWCPISPHMTLIVPHQLASNPTGLEVEQKSSSVEINSALKARTKDLERRSKSNDHPHFDQSDPRKKGQETSQPGSFTFKPSG